MTWRSLALLRYISFRCYVYQQHSQCRQWTCYTIWCRNHILFRAAMRWESAKIGRHFNARLKCRRFIVFDLYRGERGPEHLSRNQRLKRMHVLERALKRPLAA